MADRVSRATLSKVEKSRYKRNYGMKKSKRISSVHGLWSVVTHDKFSSMFEAFESNFFYWGFFKFESLQQFWKHSCSNLQNMTNAMCNDSNECGILDKFKIGNLLKSSKVFILIALSPQWIAENCWKFRYMNVFLLLIFYLFADDSDTLCTLKSALCIFSASLIWRKNLQAH